MAEQTSTPKRSPVARPWTVTLVLGRGAPRLRLRAILAGLLWGALIWLIYPYALSVTRWPSDARYIGVVLLGVCALLLMLLLRSAARVIWHLGLLWLLLATLALFGGATVARARVAGGDLVAELGPGAEAVAADLGKTAQRTFAASAQVPGDLYTAVSGQPPIWLPPPTTVLDPMVLEPTGTSDDVVLASEQTPEGLTRGVLVRTRTDDGTAVRLRTGAGTDNDITGRVQTGTLLVVTGGPRLVRDEVWWQVADVEQEGWCLSTLLVLVSR